MPDYGNEEKRSLSPLSVHEMKNMSAIYNTSTSPEYPWWFILVISAPIVLGSAVIWFVFNLDPDVVIGSQNVNIARGRRISIRLNNITEITLIDKTMREIGVGAKRKGSGGIGQALKGYFNVRRGSDEIMLLYVQSKSSPTIRIQRKDDIDVFISFRDGRETENLYIKLMERLQNDVIMR